MNWPKRYRFQPNDILRSLCYYCYARDYLEKSYVEGIPFHQECLIIANDHKEKYNLIFELMDLFQIHQSELFMERLFLKYLSSQDIAGYKLIFNQKKERILVFVLTETSIVKCEVTKDDEEVVYDIPKSDFLIINSLFK